MRKVAETFFRTFMTYSYYFIISKNPHKLEAKNKEAYLRIAEFSVALSNYIFSFLIM